jgi:hypothetical protein
MEQQQCDQLCSLAVASFVNKFYGGSITQCQLAGERVGSNCCSAPDVAICNTTCNQPQWLVFCISACNNLQNTFNNQVSFSDIKKQIDLCQPIGLSFNWVNSTPPAGHSVAIVAYAEGPLGQFIYICDPGDGTTNQVDYNDFIGDPGSYQGRDILWYETDYTMKNGV